MDISNNLTLDISEFDQKTDNTPENLNFINKTLELINMENVSPKLKKKLKLKISAEEKKIVFENESNDIFWGRHSTQSILESGRPIHRICKDYSLRG